MDTIITSLQNPKVKEIVKLRDRRARKQTDLFLIEGYRELLRALDAGRSVETLFYCPEFFLGSNEESLKKRCKAAVQCTKEVFSKISYRDRPDGLLAVAPQMHLGLKDLVLKKKSFLVIAESIEKPGNLGTILRSSDAAGVDAVIVCDPQVDIHNPNVVRSSVGTLFTIPVIEAGAEETLDFLNQHNIEVVAATPHADQNYTEANLSQSVGICVGAEQYGLSETWMKNARIKVRIPMCGIADSLNVASATTLILYEVLRQRNTLL